MPIVGNRRKSHERLRPGEAAVGLDLGTTGARACIIYDKHAENISSSDQLCDSSRSDSDVNFGASVNPFQFDDEVTPTVRQDAEMIPLKFTLYVLQILEKRQKTPRSRYETEVRRDIPQIKTFFTRYDAAMEEHKRQAIQRLEHAFTRLLERIEEQTRSKAEMHQLSTKRVIATIPSTWTRWMQAYYAMTLAIVWKLDTDSIDIIYESEAIANLLLNRYKNLRSARSGLRFLVLIDLGGHTLNINTYFFKRHYSDPTRFSVYGMENDICVHGGMELHASLVKARILQEIESGTLKVPRNKQREIFAQYMSSYRDQRMNLQGQEFFLYAALTPGNSVAVKFDEDEAKIMHQKCFDEALKAISRHFDEVAEYGEPQSTQVVLTGGSFRNTHLMAVVQEKIKNYGFVHRDSRQLSLDAKQAGDVAVGAGCAFLNAQPVKEFVHLASFAVQQSNDGSKPDAVIWDNGISQMTRVYLPGTQGTERFITCCPVPETAGATTIDVQSTYRLALLPRSLTAGYYRIRMEYLDALQSPTGCDVVRIWYKKELKHDTNLEEKFEFPIYYDFGPRVCFDDIDKRPRHRRNRQRACAQGNEDNAQHSAEAHLPLSELESRLQTELKERMKSWTDEKTTIAVPSGLQQQQGTQITAEEDKPAPSRMIRITRGRKRHASSSLPVPSNRRKGTECATGDTVDGQHTRAAPWPSSSSSSVDAVPEDRHTAQKRRKQPIYEAGFGDDMQDLVCLGKTHATFIR
ncbi:hypothetical protein NLG97_g2041 [Lecanicillium saksenae]|uniref:Uncharacterized protein n=1 Tax=Lecanicillium saksenae TaxID=468837 RepID=A0ACC1R5B8_9HYPO|nr:hypothetical protein NLG97_g2041 [Lecanicillium saksenae]